MSTRESRVLVPKSKYVPKHRSAPVRPASGPRLVRTTVVLSGLAVAATGASVGGGVVTAAPVPSAPSASQDAVTAAQELVAGFGSSGGGTDRAADARRERRDTPTASRSDRRTPASTGKAQALGTGEGGGVVRTESLAGADPRTIGRALLPEYGFSDDQWACLDALFVSESDWRVNADNPTSTAYGIPQALTGLHDVPEGYFTSAEVQIRWGLDYIADTYGTPCSAWSFKQGNNWY